MFKDAASGSKKFRLLWGPPGAKVSELDFELRKEREFQNSSRGVRAKAPTPPSQQSKLLLPKASWLIV
ncbi:hypothetical protein LNA01_15950 [Companilactobacillus nantensis]|nr:hypothetical protein LNA01_15950 [Companilactobacillus nantensis]